MSILGTRGWDLKAWRYRLAHLLNLLPGTCWARLVMWVEYGQEPLRDCGQDWGCSEPARGADRCYCGKVRTAAEAARDRSALLQRAAAVSDRRLPHSIAAGIVSGILLGVVLVATVLIVVRLARG